MPTPNLWINTTLVKWTPSGGTLVNLNRITQAGFSWNAEVINNRADLDIYDSSAHVVGSKPTVTFAGNNAVLYLNLVSGIGAITWQVGNADDQAGTGSVIYAMNPAMNPLGDYSGPHGQYASGNLSMMGLAVDGLTNPMSYTISSAGSFVRRARPGVVQGVRPVKLAKMFRLPGVADDHPADRPPDAVLVHPNAFAATPTHFVNIATMQVEAARILGVDPDEVSVRAQGQNRVITRSSRFAFMHPKDHELAGQHRLRWKDRGDGVTLGFLTDDALQADEDAAEDAA